MVTSHTRFYAGRVGMSDGPPGSMCLPGLAIPYSFFPPASLLLRFRYICYCSSYRAHVCQFRL